MSTLTSGGPEDTIKHLFIDCRNIRELKELLCTKIQIKTVGEEEILYHEGRIKWKKKISEIVAAYCHSIWISRAKLYYGNITSEQDVKSTMKAIFFGIH